MKIYPNQLKSSLQGGLKALYLISGDIPILANESAKIIQTYAQQQGFSETLRYQVDTEFDWENFINLLEHSSLFQKKQYIELHTSTLQLGQGADLLMSYAKNPHPDKLLVLITPKLDSKTQKTQWIKQITEQGIHITIWPLDFSRYLQWLDNQLKEQGLLIEPQALRLLAEYTEGNYAAATQTVEKIALAYSNESKKIGIEEISELTTKAYQYNLFDWIDACLIGNQNRMILIFNVLRNSNVEPTLMLWTITSEIRKLIQLNFHINQKLSIDQAFKQLDIWEKKQSLFQKSLSRHDSYSLESLLKTAHHVDKVLKGVVPGDIWDELMMLGLKL